MVVVPEGPTGVADPVLVDSVPLLGAVEPPVGVAETEVESGTTTKVDVAVGEMIETGFVVEATMDSVDETLVGELPGQ